MRSRPEKRQRYEGMRLHGVSVFREPYLIESYSCTRRIRRWRGLRHPKQKLPLFPNNQFISCTIENVDSAWVSRIGVRSIPARARENDSGFFSVLTSPSPSPCVPKELLPDQDTAIYQQILHTSTPDCCLLASSIPCLPQRVNTQLLENVFILYIREFQSV